MLASRIAKRCGIRGLYAVTPEHLPHEHLLARCTAALANGARVLQLRDKTAERAARLALARSLRDLCAAYSALFIVNDDAELAAASGADGVHLGRHDATLAEVRAAHPSLLIGASCYDDPELAAACVRAGADYVAFGSMFASPVKPDAVRAPFDVFRATASLGVPRVAIGGITRANCRQVIDAGADACAVITDLFGSVDDADATVAQRAAEFRTLFEHRMPTTETSADVSSHFPNEAQP